MDYDDLEVYDLTHTQELRGLREPVQVIEGILPAGGVTGLTAYPGVGKTWLAMEIMRAVCTGEDFLGRYKVNLPGAVLFVGNDASVFDYARQWTRLTKDIPDEKLDHAWFLCASDFMLDNDEEVMRLIKTSNQYVVVEDEVQHHEDPLTGETWESIDDRTNFEVIIFDTLSRLCSANQNDNSEMEEVFRNVRAISERTGAAVILLHHNSKPNDHNEGSDWRGAMSQIGALDSWIHLKKPKPLKGRDPNAPILISAQFKKFRGITPADFGYAMDVAHPDYAKLAITEEPVTREERLVKGDFALAVLEAIKKEPGLTQAGYRKLLALTHRDEFDSEVDFQVAVRNRIAALVKAGTLTQTGTHRQATYTPTEEKA